MEIKIREVVFRRKFDPNEVIKALDRATVEYRKGRGQKHE